MTRWKTILLGGLALGVAACSESVSTEPTSQSVTDPANLTFHAGLGDDLLSVPNPCPASGAEDFDFWVGTWQLRRPSGELFATTVVSEELDGCVVMEDFINAGGNQARSMSAYDAATGVWHQIYQDNLLGNWRMEGGLDGSSMKLENDQQIYNFNTGTFQRREALSTWVPAAGGTVTQTIVGTLAGTPLTFFDALYEPVTNPVRAQPAFFPFCQFVISGFRQLDFWLGDWGVRAENGTTVGEATVFSDLNGCMLQADFIGRNGLLRRSFMVYDFPTGKWYRYIAENTGEFVKLSGTWDGTALTLTGSDESPSGSSVEVRNIIRSRDDQVVETWETRLKSGTWSLVATRIYESG
jgi:hypothetical protein